MEKDFEERKGYKFIGWYIDPEFTKRLNPGGILPHKLTLYDKWVPEDFIINYELNGGENHPKNPKTINIESGLVKLYPPTRKDRCFVGWTLNGKPISLIPPGVDRPITLVAHYRRLPKVMFETRGGGMIERKSVETDLRLKPFRPPLKLGYEFENWYYDPNYTMPFSFDHQIQHSCMLYAKWKVKTYTITYDVDGGLSSRSNPKQYTYFDDSILLKPAYKKGYKFVGWFDQRGNEQNEILKYSIGHKHFIAHYERL